jgi:hypothetical protein
VSARIFSQFTIDRGKGIEMVKGMNLWSETELLQKLADTENSFVERCQKRPWKLEIEAET